MTEEHEQSFWLRFIIVGLTGIANETGLPANLCIDQLGNLADKDELLNALLDAGLIDKGYQFTPAAYEIVLFPDLPNDPEFYRNNPPTVALMSSL